MSQERAASTPIRSPRPAARNQKSLSITLRVERRKLNEFSDLMNDEAFSDVSITVGAEASSKTYKCHKNILGVSSKYFRSEITQMIVFFPYQFPQKFLSGLNRNKEEASFPDWDPQDFDVVRLWLYTATLPNLRKSNVCNVWRIADYLLIDSLKEAILDFIERQKLSPEDVLLVLSVLEPSFKDLNVLDTCNTIIGSSNLFESPNVVACKPELSALYVQEVSIEVVRLIAAWGYGHERQNDVFPLVANWISSLPEHKSSSGIHLGLSSVLLAELDCRDIMGHCAVSKNLSAERVMLMADLQTAKMVLSASKLKRWAQRWCDTKTDPGHPPIDFIISTKPFTSSNFDIKLRMGLGALERPLGRWNLINLSIKFDLEQRILPADDFLASCYAFTVVGKIYGTGPFRQLKSDVSLRQKKGGNLFTKVLSLIFGVSPDQSSAANVSEADTIVVMLSAALVMSRRPVPSPQFSSFRASYGSIMNTLAEVTNRNFGAEIRRLLQILRQIFSLHCRQSVPREPQRPQSP